MTLVEVMVALALACLFLLFVSMLEVTSLHGVTFLKHRARAEALASSVLAEARAGWMRGHQAPPDGSRSLDGTTYAWSVSAAPASLGTEMVALPPAAVKGRDWTETTRFTVTVEWTQAEGAPTGRLVRTCLLTDTASSMVASPSPGGGAP